MRNRTTLIFTTLWAVLMMILIISSLSYAQLPTDVENTSIALNFDRIVDDTGWGVLASTPIHVGKIDGYAAGIMQRGSLYRGKYHVEAGINAGNFALRGIVFGTVKGYSLDALGTDRNVGVAIDTPEVKGASIRIGIFGKNAGEFGRPNARDTLEDNGYDPNTLDGLGLESISPPPAGLSFKAGKSLNALVSVDFNLQGVSFSIKGMPQLTGEGDPAHQAIVSAHVSRNISKNIGLDIGAELGLQSWQDEIERETAYFIAVGLDF